MARDDKSFYWDTEEYSHSQNSAFKNLPKIYTTMPGAVSHENFNMIIRNFFFILNLFNHLILYIFIYDTQFEKDSNKNRF